ncbi:MAG: tetratricopeptide repeat protein [Sandaracinus sp.]
MDDGTRDARDGDSTAPYEEEFLFHLSRGSEYLVENHVERAKEELERALRYQPDDAKGQDLLASVYFRLGLYPRAIEIWSRLARQYPNDLALRVNLGLVLLKTGQPEDARASFQRATEIDPGHARAYRYLGLAQWRCGELDRARASFLKGGEVTMARRMEEMLGDAPAEEKPARPSLAPSSAGSEPAPHDGVRSAASGALERLASSNSTPPLAVEEAAHEAPAASGRWSVVEQGREAVPRTVRREHAEGRTDVSSLAQRIDAWSVETDQAPSLSVAANGLLVLSAKHEVVSRLGRVRASRGVLTGHTIPRRGRGEREAEDAVLGGLAAPLLRLPGPVHAFVAPPPEERFVAIALSEDVVFVVESRLEAFDASLSHEAARVGRDVEVVSLRGTGNLVLRVPAEPSALDVRTGDVALADPSALVGWTGRLFPVDAESSAVEGRLAFRGEGTLLVL